MQTVQNGSTRANFRSASLFFFIACVLTGGFYEAFEFTKDFREVGVILFIISPLGLLGWLYFARVDARKRDNVKAFLERYRSESSVEDERFVTSLYGLEPKMFTWDRFFKIFIDAQGLRGAYLCAQVYDETSARLQLVDTSVRLRLFKPHMTQKILHKRAERESFYEEAFLNDEEFLQSDRRNFFFPAETIEAIEYNPVRSWWTLSAMNSGILKIRLNDGTSRKFILTGEQPVTATLATLENCFGNVSIA